MLRERFVIGLLAILICALGIRDVRAQGQPPPPMPPGILYGTAYVDGSPLDQSDTGNIISIRMERLLLIFLDDADSQTVIATIISELNIGATDALRQAFADSAYCQSRGTALSNSATVAETLVNEWHVVDGGATYTVLSQAIDVWDGAWSAGVKLEVYEHDGVIASYNMGDYSVDEYVLETPISPGTVYGGLSPDTYLIRDPGKAIAGEGANIDINGIRIIDPALPYIISEEAFVELNIYAPSTYEVSIDLSADWNLISLPVQPQNTDRDVILASIDGKYDAIWTFDAVTGQWSRYVVGGQPFLNNLNVVEAGVGYWIEMNQAGTLVVQGTDPGTIIPLRIGWNLVGCNSLVSKAIVVALASIVDKYESIWAYNAVLGTWLRYVPDGQPFLNDLESIDPTKGYWIEATENSDWDIGP